MKVQKFGGACLADKDGFLRVADIIIRDRVKRKVVVISAVSGVTDQIEQALPSLFANEDEVGILINKIKEIHETLAIKLIQDDGKALKKTSDAIIKKLQKLERLLYGVVYTEELTERTRALILSFGERLAVILMAGLLESKGYRAKAMDSEATGMITDDSFANATADMPRTRRKLRAKVLPLLNKGVTPIITGYYGCTRDGKITTFGRNGSDYSAAVIASCLDARLVELWKDVDGFMSADPKLVPKAHHIYKLSYYEAAELSYFGARILHQRTSEPLMETSPIPIKIRNIKDPGSTPTTISRSSYEKSDVVKSVTYNKDLAVLKIWGPGVGYKPGIITDIGELLSGSDVNIYSVITSQTCINLLLDSKDAEFAFESIKELSGGVIEKVEVQYNIVLIGVVGEGLLKAKGLAARVFTAVAKEKVAVDMISAGASKVAYYFIIPKRDLKKTINAIHKEYFSKKRKG